MVVLACLGQGTDAWAQQRGASGALDGQETAESSTRLTSNAEADDPESEPDEPVDSSPLTSQPSVIPKVQRPGELRWINPYETGTGSRRDACGGQCWFIPQGMIPFWGPRTNERDRFTGHGQPLQGTSWLNRPYGAGWFAGGMMADRLIADHVNQGGGFYGGYRLGWDYDYYWGAEARIGAAEPGIFGPRDIDLGRTDDILLTDVSMLYYPWGDSRWRPYATWGIGGANFQFRDEHGARFNHWLFDFPFGLGMKYCCHEWLVLRMELLDNLAVGGGGLATMHNVSVTGGVEVRFGGVRTSYWPWNPGRTIW
jgi:hypothetical protein